MRTSVVLADDHPVVREGVRHLLESHDFEILGEASDGFEVLTLLERLHPDVALLDLAMPGLNGVGAAREIAKTGSRTKVVLLTMYEEEHHVLEAFRAGVKGWISKSQAPDQLIQAIREVCAGGVYLSPNVSGLVMQRYLEKTDFCADPLTDRERQVLQLISEGKTTKEVAIRLGVTVKTAESHRSSLMNKLDIHSTVELVHYAIRRGLVQP
jgi:DNA-binding NarL/FixJ family response regulator